MLPSYLCAPALVWGLLSSLLRHRTVQSPWAVLAETPVRRCRGQSKHPVCVMSCLELQQLLGLKGDVVRDSLSEVLAKLAHACEVLFRIVGKVTLDLSQTKSGYKTASSWVSIRGCCSRSEFRMPSACSHLWAPELQWPCTPESSCCDGCSTVPWSVNTARSTLGWGPTWAESDFGEGGTRGERPRPPSGLLEGHRSARGASSTLLCSKPPLILWCVGSRASMPSPMEASALT